MSPTAGAGSSAALGSTHGPLPGVPPAEPRLPVRLPRIAEAARRFYFSWLTAAALLLGTVLRTREWLHDKSLWLDEISITRAITSFGYARLLGPLGSQGGPVGWLWAERSATNLFGISELSLRLVPFLASLLALLIFPRVAQALVGPVVTPAATLLMATSPTLIYYAAETKQYASDCACALLVLLVTTGLAARLSPEASRAGDRRVRYSLVRHSLVRHCVLWGLTCGALAWCSQPAILVAGGCAVWLIVNRARGRTTLIPIVAGCVVLGVIVAAEWFITLKALAGNEALAQYWQAYGGYPPEYGGRAEQVRWLGRTLDLFAVNVGQFRYPAVVGVLALAGLATLATLRRWSAVLLLLLLLAAAGAAVTRHYPLAQRLALYLYPEALLLLTAPLAAAGPWAGRRTTSRWRRAAVLLSVAALVVTTGPAAVAGVRTLVRPDDVTAGREALQFVAAHREPSDVVLADQWAQLTFAFYGPREHVRADGEISFESPTSRPCLTDALAPIAGARRVWLVLAHHPSNEPADRNAVYESQFAARGSVLATYRGAGGAVAELFDLSKPPSAPRPPLQPWIDSGCFTVRLGPL